MMSEGTDNSQREDRVPEQCTCGWVDGTPCRVHPDLSPSVARVQAKARAYFNYSRQADP